MDHWIVVLTPIFLAVFRFIIAILFLTSSVSKTRNPHAFMKAVYAYHLLPPSAIRPFAVSLILIELILGITLILGWESSLAAGISVLLFVAFAVAIWINLLRGRENLSCGCFGEKNSGIISPWLVGRDILLAYGYQVSMMTAHFWWAKYSSAMRIAP
ncbi:MAG: hypothetical protein PHQ40_21150 [Anaerolineaceae bacterium]|nr:hypothetical protein [Anaerolineaceae bacterium]